VGSDNALQVARALEGSEYNSEIGRVWIREDNHQLIQPVYVSTFKKQGTNGVVFDTERTGIGTKTDFVIEPEQTMLPTTCEMVRP